MPTFTNHYNFNKPLVNNATDADLWGGQLNSNWDDVDSLLFTGLVSDGDKGDITVSASGATWTLSTQAANTVLANATAGTASPTAVAIGASELVGRGDSGDITPITLGTGLSMSGSTLSATSTSKFTSSNLPITAGSGGTIAHGLGGVPDIITVDLVCIVANQGYSVGEVVPYFGQGDTNAPSGSIGFVYTKAAANIEYRVGALQLLFLNKSNGVIFVVSPTNWQFRINAVRFA